MTEEALARHAWLWWRDADPGATMAQLARYLHMLSGEFITPTRARTLLHAGFDLHTDVTAPQRVLDSYSG